MPRAREGFPGSRLGWGRVNAPWGGRGALTSRTVLAGVVVLVVTSVFDRRGGAVSNFCRVAWPSGYNRPVVNHGFWRAVLAVFSNHDRPVDDHLPGRGSRAGPDHDGAVHNYPRPGTRAGCGAAHNYYSGSGRGRAGPYDHYVAPACRTMSRRMVHGHRATRGGHQSQSSQSACYCVDHLKPPLLKCPLGFSCRFMTDRRVSSGRYSSNFPEFQTIV
jgi:hypothetical protein